MLPVNNLYIFLKRCIYTLCMHTYISFIYTQITLGLGMWESGCLGLGYRDLQFMYRNVDLLNLGHIINGRLNASTCIRGKENSSHVMGLKSY